MRKMITAMIAVGAACGLAGCQTMAEAPATASAKTASTATQTAPDPQTGVETRG